MNASNTIMRLELQLARINPVVIFLAVLIRTPWVQAAARIVSKSLLCRYLDWNSKSGKWRVRAILFIFAIFSFFIFVTILHLASAPGIVSPNLMYALFYVYCVAATVLWVVFGIALAMPVAKKIKALSSITMHSNFFSKIEIYAYQFFGRDIEPEIRPPLQNSGC